MAKQTFTTGQVLTAAQMTSLQQTAMLGGAASAKTASYTLVAADAGTAISMSSASATTITVNTALFAAGDTVQITNLGAGVCTITAGTATVNTASSLALAQYESGTLDFTSASAAIFIKGAGAVAGGGGMTLLSTTTLSGATTTVSSIDQTYKNLNIVIVNAYASGGNNSYIQFNSDTGSNYGYRFNNSGSADQGSAVAFAYLGAFGTTQGYYDGSYVSITIPRYSETEYKSTIFTATKGNNLYLGNNSWNNTAAITAITIGVTAGQTMSGGTMYIYGVK